MNNYEKHAWREFKAAGWLMPDGKTFEDDMQKMICEHVMKLLNVFNGEGHSGSSAHYTLGLFDKLAKFEPICSLKGDESEWNEVGDGVYQNNRCSHIFKDKNRFDGQAYDVDGIVFWEWWSSEDGKEYKSYYTNGGSHVPITFPYIPESKYVYRKSEAEPLSPEQTEEGIIK